MYIIFYQSINYVLTLKSLFLHNFYFKLLKMYAHSQAAGRFPNQPQHNAYGGYPPNQGMPPPQYLPQQGYPQPLGQHSQLYGDSSQNPQRGSIRGTTNQMQTKKAGLMQPPALNVE